MISRKKILIKIIIFLLIILAISIVIIGSFYIKERIKETTVRKDSQLLSQAFQSGDLSFCEKIKNLKIREQCYGIISTKIPDISLCEKIQDIFAKEGCYGIVAFQLNDPTICKKNFYNPKQRVPFQYCHQSRKYIHL